MKYVFNVLVAFVVLWIVWSVIDHKPKDTGVKAASADSVDGFAGARILKTCKNYFSKPMSVEFCNDAMFVSNVVTEPDAMDSVGYVCRTSLYGEIVDTLRIDGLNSPKGMVEHGGYLYIADINRIAKYDVEADTLVAMIPVPGAKYLFDMEKDRAGRLYVSDSYGERVYRIDGDSAVLFACDTLCANISGLCYYNNNLYAGAKNRILRIDSLGRVKTVFNTAYSVCGIRSDDEGNFITTDFVGNVYAVGRRKAQLLVGRRQGVQAADVGYLPEQRILVVPTYGDNSVELYEMGKYLQ